MSTERWGDTPTGEPVERVTLVNDQGLVAKITNLGATLTELWVSDATGVSANVVLGFESLDGYLGPHPYFGSTVGRVANRIGGAKFMLDGVEYRVTANEGLGHLHGGAVGFHQRVWDLASVEEHAVEMRLLSPAGEEGYPGALDIAVRYSLAEDGLRIGYRAISDAPTPINVTNHSYFNLAGSGTILDHVLEIEADDYTPTDVGLIPTGHVVPVDGAAVDFTVPKRVGEQIGEYRSHANGYDHNFVVRGEPGLLRRAARLTDPVTGRLMEVWTTEPGIQLYTGNWLDGTITGTGGITYFEHSGLCLETQHFPDAVNHPGFPTTVLRPGDTFRSKTEYRFAADE